MKTKEHSICGKSSILWKLAQEALIMYNDVDASDATLICNGSYNRINVNFVCRTNKYHSIGRRQSSASYVHRTLTSKTTDLASIPESQPLQRNIPIITASNERRWHVILPHSNVSFSVYIYTIIFNILIMCTISLSPLHI